MCSFWEGLGAMLGHFFAILAHFLVVLARLGFFNRFFAIWARFFKVWAAFWEDLGSIFRRFFELSWKMTIL